MKRSIRLLAMARVAPYTCLRCGHGFDAVSGVGSEPRPLPDAGSVSLCIRCGHLAIFTGADPVLRQATAEERAACEADPELSRVRRILAQAIAERPS